MQRMQYITLMNNMGGNWSIKGWHITVCVSLLFCISYIFSSIGIYKRKNFIFLIQGEEHEKNFSIIRREIRAGI